MRDMSKISQLLPFLAAKLTTECETRPTHTSYDHLWNETIHNPSQTRSYDPTTYINITTSTSQIPLLFARHVLRRKRCNSERHCKQLRPSGMLSGPSEPARRASRLQTTAQNALRRDSCHFSAHLDVCSAATVRQIVDSQSAVCVEHARCACAASGG